MLHLNKVDFIKIDTEGGEWEVLKGSKNLISKFNPLIYAEFNTFAYLQCKDDNPKFFLNWIFDNFEYVGLMNHFKRGHGLLHRYKKGSEITILHENIYKDHSYADIILTNNHDYISKLEELGPQ